jgi:hypothetical protein
MFADYAKDCGFRVNGEFEFEAGRLLFVAVEGDAAGLENLAQFTLTRVVRPMPHLRAARPVTRSMPLAVSFSLPSGEPLSREPKVAILDGGLPKEHVLDGYVRRYFLADEEASDVPDFTDHGLGVTSAVLFGPIEPEAAAERPYAPVDHHRVLDTKIDGEDPYELYRTLGHVETVLLSRQYQFINLSLGPDLPIEDQDVHAWTAVIDSILSDGETLMTVAVGNNGERDAALSLNRIQVPSDSVNALSVGAADRREMTGNAPATAPPALAAAQGVANRMSSLLAAHRRSISMSQRRASSAKSRRHSGNQLRCTARITLGSWYSRHSGRCNSSADHQIAVGPWLRTQGRA